MAAKSNSKELQAKTVPNSLEILLSETQEKLRQSQKDYFQILEAMPQMIWITDAKGKYEFYNQQWYDFTRTLFKDVGTKKWMKIYHPEDLPESSRLWRTSLKTGKPYSMEFRLKNGNTGEWRWILGRALPLKDENGKITKWVGTCTDIDDQKRTQQNLHYLSKSSKILSSSLDYKTTFNNIAFLAVPEIADWCAIEMKSDKGNEQVVVAHKDPKKVKWAVELNKTNPPDPNAQTGVPQVLRTGKSEFYPVITDEFLVAAARNKEELELTRKLGFSSVIVAPIKTDKEVLGAITLVSAESGKYYTQDDLVMAEELASRASFAIQNSILYKIAQDELKIRRKLEGQLVVANEKLEQKVQERTQALHQSNLELQRSNKELEDFAYVASHDLQEPLRKIQAFGNLLEEEYASVLNGGTMYVQRMQHAAARMRTLIDDLLAFSRVTTKAQDMIEVDLNTIIKDTIIDMEIRINELKAKIIVENLAKVKADPLQMRQLFQNLISNALKFHKENMLPHITITGKNDLINGKSYYSVYVKDNGIGFDEKYSDRIFTVFQRLHGKEDYEGTGVGLAVVRKIVERHNGTITAKSAIGKGTTFVITLPINDKRRNIHDKHIQTNQNKVTRKAGDKQHE